MQIAGIDEAPDEEWMFQQARNLTAEDKGFLKSKKFLIHDRDPLFTAQFRQTMKAGGVRTLKMPKQSPNLNDYASWCTSWVRSVVSWLTRGLSASLQPCCLQGALVPTGS